MSQLIIAIFEGQHAANDVLSKLRKMEEEWVISLDEVAVLTRDPDGDVRLTSSHKLTEEASIVGGSLGVLLGLVIGAAAANPIVATGGILIGAASGAGVGALAGALDQAQEEEHFVEKVASNLKPDSSALAMLAWISRPTKLLESLEGHKGQVIETSLSAKNERALRELLEGEEGKKGGSAE